MRMLKKMTGVILAACMAVAVMIVPDAKVYAQATLESNNVDITVESQYSSIIKVKYSQGDAQIKNIKTNSKNLIAKQTEQYWRKEANSYSDYPYGYAEISLYARKAGKYKVTFEVCDVNGAKLSKHTVKVTASDSMTVGTYPIKKATFANKVDAFYTPTNKTSGKFKVVMNKGYKLQSITMTYYNEKGERVEQTIKNNAKVTLGNYARKSEWEDNYNYRYSSYWNYYLSTDLFAKTEFQVTYQNKKTKAIGMIPYTMYRMPLN